MRIPIVAEDNSVRFWMKYPDALESLRAGKIEEVFNEQGAFIGVRLLEPNQPQQSESFHRTTADTSPATITKKDMEMNATAHMTSRARGRYFENRARRKVKAWPIVHDRNAVVISAGKVHGAIVVSRETLVAL